MPRGATTVLLVERQPRLASAYASALRAAGCGVRLNQACTVLALAPEHRPAAAIIGHYDSEDLQLVLRLLALEPSPSTALLADSIDRTLLAEVRASGCWVIARPVEAAHVVRVCELLTSETTASGTGRGYELRESPMTDHASYALVGNSLHGPRGVHRLRPAEARLLDYLIQHRREPVGWPELARQVLRRSDEGDAAAGAVRRQVANLRSAMTGSGIGVEASPGIGYRLQTSVPESFAGQIVNVANVPRFIETGASAV